ncbi:MAG: hypothetical protein ACYCQJ_11170 [Nitrososphaerales archaeon]
MKISKSLIFLALIVIFIGYGFYQAGGLVYAGSVNIVLIGVLDGIIAYIVLTIALSIFNWIKNRNKEERPKQVQTL